VNAVIRLGLESGSSDIRPDEEDEDEAMSPWQDLVESIGRRDGPGSEKAMRNLLTGGNAAR
jgi:hypothetical protein